MVAKVHLLEFQVHDLRYVLRDGGVDHEKGPEIVDRVDQLLKHMLLRVGESSLRQLLEEAHEEDPDHLLAVSGGEVGGRSKEALLLFQKSEPLIGQTSHP